MSASLVTERGPPEIKLSKSDSESIPEKGDSCLVPSGSQHLHRKLGVKEVQLFALSAAIGTCMFYYLLTKSYTRPFNTYRT